jgi:hypothetical protein
MKDRSVQGMRFLLLVGAVCFGGATLWAQAPAAEAETVVIRKTAQPVSVDGVLDEECWKSAVPVKADFIKGENGKLAEAPQMVAKYTWDDQYLYVAYETFDTNLVAKGNGVTKGPADNRREGCEISSPADVVEFFVGFNNSNMFWEVHHSAGNHFNDILVFKDLPAWKSERPAIPSYSSGIYWAVNEYLQDVVLNNVTNKRASAVQLKPRADGKPSTLNDPSDTDTGYIAELRFPWAALAAPAAARDASGWKKMAGREITLLAVVENGDNPKQPYHTSCATLPRSDFFHNHFARWPRYKLAAE